MIFIKVLFFSLLNIIELNFDLFISVDSSMFVSETKQVNKFVQNNTIITETFVRQYQIASVAPPTDIALATTIISSFLYEDYDRFSIEKIEL